MLSQIDLFHDCFDRVDDPRVTGRTKHPLNSILFLVVAAMIADADGPEEIEDFGNERIAWLSQFADFSAGIPSHDTIGRVLSLIKPEQFQQALVDWHSQLCAGQHGASLPEEGAGPVHIAIDGKTSRGSYTDAEKSNALHFVSAWATKHGVALGQTQVGSKTNEITAIDELLDFIDVRGTIITLDAIGAQKTIAKKITDKQGDYIFAIKDNHPKLADASRIRTANATANFTFTRRYITTLLKRDTSKHSLKRKRKLAGWNIDFHQELLFPAPI